MACREMMRQRFEAVVEYAIRGRGIGFMSGNQQHADIICEVFILAPSDVIGEDQLSPAPPRIEH
jgi:hypothetical protein